jgi:hypothetical protein
MSLLDKWGVRQNHIPAIPAIPATPGIFAVKHGGKSGGLPAPGIANPLRPLAIPGAAAAMRQGSVPGIADGRKPLAIPENAESRRNAGVFRTKTQESQESQESQGVNFSTALADNCAADDFPAEPRNAEAGAIGTIGTARDALLVDLQAAFADDSPASHAAAERLAKVRVTDSPVGDDLPVWRGWMKGRYEHWLERGYSRAEAWRIVWGDAEDEWHKRHGAVPAPDRCAGCGERLMPGEGLELPDGAVVHRGNPEVVACPAVYGAQWRGAASVALMAMGLMRPWL